MHQTWHAGSDHAEFRSGASGILGQESIRASRSAELAAALGSLDEVLYRKNGEVLAFVVVEQGIAGRTLPAIPGPAGVPVPSWRVGLTCTFGNTGREVRVFFCF